MILKLSDRFIFKLYKIKPLISRIILNFSILQKFLFFYWKKNQCSILWNCWYATHILSEINQQLLLF